MNRQGIFVVGFSFPVVPIGEASITTVQVQIAAAYTCEHLDAALGHFADVGKELGVI